MFRVSNNFAVSLLRWSEFFFTFMLVLPIIFVLYSGKGITINEFFLIHAIYLTTVFLFQLPFGYISDIFSRRKVMLFGVIAYFMAYVVLFFSYGFYQVMLVEILIGLAVATFGGTRESYAYDLLKRLKREKEFLREWGSINVYGQAAAFIATIIGGFAFGFFGNTIVAINGAIVFMAIICVYMLPELSEVKRKVAKKNPFQDIASIIKMIIKHPQLKWFMLFPAFFGSFTLIMMWILQPTMLAASVPVILFGIFVGINQFSRVIFAKYAYKLEEVFGVKNLLYAGVGGIVLSIFAVLIALGAGADNMWLVYIMCVIIAIVPATQKLMQLMFNSLMHHKIKSTERATVLSTSMTLGALFAAATMIMMNLLLGEFSIAATMFVVLAMFMLILYPLHKILNMERY